MKRNRKEALSPVLTSEVFFVHGEDRGWVTASKSAPAGSLVINY